MNSSSGSTPTSSPSPSGSSNAANNKNAELRAIVGMMEEGIPARVLLSHIAPTFPIPPHADEMMLWRIIISMIDPPKRKKLTQYNTIGDAINLIKNSKNIVVLSGAGISTSAGLPDFRSRNGIYVQIHEEYPDLHDPKFMFDIDYFRRNPLPFYRFAKALYPGQYKPTVGHKFIKCIEDHNKLLRNYSQNIDTLEKQAGIRKVVECHGSFSTATCTNCRYTVDGDIIRGDIMDQKVPRCPKCHSSGGEPQDRLGLMKPDIVFFGEQLGENFHNSLESDKSQVDLLIVIGSSLKVRPVALIPKSIPANVPQILINKEPLDHMDFDIELLGDCDHIIQEICLRLGDSWTNICDSNTGLLTEIVGIHSDAFKPKQTVISDKTNDKMGSNDQHLETKEEKPNKVEATLDEASMCSVRDEEVEDLGSFKSDQVNVGSECVERTMIDEQNDDMNNDAGGAIPDGDTSSDGDWEDIEILHTSDSLDLPSAKADITIPEHSYLFLKPNRYLFRGAELTKDQLTSYNRDSIISLDSPQERRR